MNLQNWPMWKLLAAGAGLALFAGLGLQIPGVDIGFDIRPEYEAIVLLLSASMAYLSWRSSEGDKQRRHEIQMKDAEIRAEREARGKDDTGTILNYHGDQDKGEE